MIHILKFGVRVFYSFIQCTYNSNNYSQKQSFNQRYILTLSDITVQQCSN